MFEKKLYLEIYLMIRKTSKIPVHYGPIIAKVCIMVFVRISRLLISVANADKCV